MLSVTDAVEDPVAVGELGLGLARDPVHHPDRLDRVLADRGLLGQHHRVGALEDRAGDVGDLGPGRPRRGDHRGEHLGRGDRRPRVACRRAPAAAAGRPGTCSIGSSIPRSPRATMIPAVTAWTISSARSAACGFSIFAITGMSAPPVRTRRSTGARSSARRTNETASRSIPCSIAKSTQARSSRPAAGSPTSAPGRLRPWCEDDPAADLDHAADLVVAGLDHPQPDPPVGEVDEPAGADRLGEAVAGDREPLLGADAVLGREHDLATRAAGRRCPRRRRRSAASARAGRRGSRSPCRCARPPRGPSPRSRRGRRGCRGRS